MADFQTPPSRMHGQPSTPPRLSPRVNLHGRDASDGPSPDPFLCQNVRKGRELLKEFYSVDRSPIVRDTHRPPFLGSPFASPQQEHRLLRRIDSENHYQQTRRNVTDVPRPEQQRPEAGANVGGLLLETAPELLLEGYNGRRKTM